MNDLKLAGCENIKRSVLVSNESYLFTKNNINYEMRHWLNCYGCEVDFWSVNDKDFDTYEEAIEYIKGI